MKAFVKPDALHRLPEGTPTQIACKQWKNFLLSRETTNRSGPEPPDLSARPPQTCTCREWAGKDFRMFVVLPWNNAADCQTGPRRRGRFDHRQPSVPGQKTGAVLYSRP